MDVMCLGDPLQRPSPGAVAPSGATAVKGNLFKKCCEAGGHIAVVQSPPDVQAGTDVSPKVSNLIASEILRNEEINARVSAIEKWVAVADICRCLHNYNAVLEITSSLNRSAIFRLKKTWLKVSKQVGVWG